MGQYLENGKKYVQITVSGTYALLIGTKIDELGWPWTLQVWIFREFRGISQISDATTGKRTKIDPYCQRRRCKDVELEQFWHVFASRGFVSDSWAFLFYDTPVWRTDGRTDGQTDGR